MTCPWSSVSAGSSSLPSSSTSSWPSESSPASLPSLSGAPTEESSSYYWNDRRSLQDKEQWNWIIILLIFLRLSDLLDNNFTYIWSERKSKQKKSRIRETKHLSTDADSSTASKKLLSFFFFIPPRRHHHWCRQGAFTQKKIKKNKN